jgi:hypothetical protein
MPLHRGRTLRRSPDPSAYRDRADGSGMDLRSDDAALGTLGWILVIFILLVLFGFIGFSINT